MNNDLIDHHLVDLLRIPTAHRTQTDITEAINRIGAAAELDMAPMGELQQEQNKLAAIVEFLAAELNMDTYDISLRLHERGYHSTSPLCLRIHEGGPGWCPDDWFRQNSRKGAQGSTPH